MLIENTDIATVTKKALKAKKIETAEQFEEILPVKCMDFSTYGKLEEHIGEYVLVKAQLTRTRSRIGKPTILTGFFTELDTKVDFQVAWFGQDWLAPMLESSCGKIFAVGGKVTQDEYGYKMSDLKVFTRYEAFNPCVLPVYRKITKISDDMQKTLHEKFLPYITETLTTPCLLESGLSSRMEMYKHIHFPATFDEYENARDELRFRDLLYFAAEMKKTYPKEGSGIKLPDPTVADAFVKTLPYALTDGQAETTNLIRKHAINGERMRLLVEGDVGCGKTVTAFYGLFTAVGSGYQAVLIAPTTVLAEQHFKNIQPHLNDLKALGYDITSVYLHSGMKAAEKREAQELIESGKAQIIIGTHSTFSEGYRYKNLGIIVIDEEHRFGVEQREALKAKAENGVHVISMSATPIPRSLAGVIYGDGCEVQAITTMPAGRKRVLSCITDQREKVYNFITKQLKEGRQCYVVCPLVEQDEESNKTSVEETYKAYNSRFAPLGFRTEVAHGKMKKAEMAEVIDRFKNNETQILIATTVIEVGVNVPNASVIVIENAEMFGLATLHQLRGRVGRGDYQSYCVFQSHDLGNPRLQVITSTTDGFKIAEEDMKLRGTGNLIGLEQTGFDHYLATALEYPEEYKRAKEVINKIGTEIFVAPAC